MKMEVEGGVEVKADSGKATKKKKKRETSCSQRVMLQALWDNGRKWTHKCHLQGFGIAYFTLVYSSL
jgi:hypothetical protein